MKDVYEVVGAFADGEPVDPGRLDAALADPDGRAHLIDLLALRDLMDRSAMAPATAVLPNPGRVGVWWGRWPTAAGIAIACLLGGFAAGQQAGPAPAPATAGTGVRSTAGVTGLVAPEPSTVIRLEPGVDWQEDAGGN